MWSSLEWFHQAVPVQPASFSELLSRFLHCRDEFRVEIFVIAAWCIWNSMQQRRQPSSEVFGSPGWRVGPPSPSDLATVAPPAPNIYKVNFDAAVFRSSNYAGLGVIVRDNCGAAIGALSMPTSLGWSVAE